MKGKLLALGLVFSMVLSSIMPCSASLYRTEEGCMTYANTAEAPTQQPAEQEVEIDTSGSSTVEVQETYTASVSCTAPTTMASKNQIVVSLKSGTSKAKSNYTKLMNAFRKANGKTMLTIRIASKGKYYVKSGGGSALILRPYTTLDLNGAELCRAGDMTNLIQNSSKKGSRKGKGYSLSTNIIVKNGTLNGSGGDSQACNLVNIGHASNVIFQNLNFKNCRGGHLLELSGCRNVAVASCTFTGYKRSSGEPAEAIQLDICNGKLGWNGVYASGSSGDYTPCKNITVQNCSFKNYPSGVGNHHTVKGHHNSNIKILNNTFSNAGSSSEPAVWCYGFDNSEVSGNVITGKYNCGIRVSGGSVKVSNNTFGSSKKKISYQAVYVVKANADIKGSSGSRKPENVKGGSVDNNTFYLSGSKAGIWVSNGRLSSVSGNKVYSSKKRIISISGGAKITKKENNVAI